MPAKKKAAKAAAKAASPPPEPEEVAATEDLPAAVEEEAPALPSLTDLGEPVARAWLLHRAMGGSDKWGVFARTPAGRALKAPRTLDGDPSGAEIDAVLSPIAHAAIAYERRR